MLWVTVTNSTFVGNNTADGGVGGIGIGIDAVNGAHLSNNTIMDTEFRAGITLQNNVGGEDGAVISSNRISNNTGNGILVRNAAGPVSNCVFEPNTCGGNGLSPDVKFEA